ncbi:hypothetical protein LJC61_07760 [Ruminococcaceae bacterium OttesenSCG-928-A16]|nr:hypothetical protein [Ruminococcaceae bacterium OttesenSCG-928-A16]
MTLLIQSDIIKRLVTLLPKKHGNLNDIRSKKMSGSLVLIGVFLLLLIIVVVSRIWGLVKKRALKSTANAFK